MSVHKKHGLLLSVMMFFPLLTAGALHGQCKAGHAVLSAEKKLKEHIEQCQLEEELLLEVPTKGSIEKASHGYLYPGRTYGSCTVINFLKTKTPPVHQASFQPGGHHSKITCRLFHMACPVTCFERFYYRLRETHSGCHNTSGNSIDRIQFKLSSHACVCTCIPLQIQTPGDIS